MRFLAGIVVYKPDSKRLIQNINAISKQCDKVLIVANSQFDERIKCNLIQISNVQVIYNNTNLGIAKALNQILDYSIKNHYDWFLTLDQDSIVIDNLINIYKKYVKYENVGLICCKYADDNVTNKVIDNNEYSYIDRCITSGSLCNTNVFCQIDGFDNEMFIDYVDFDICSTLLENGYKILQVNIYGINHKIGESKEFRILWKKIVLYNHSPLRCYYYVRNGLYYIKKHQKNIKTYREKILIIKRVILILVFEKNRFAKLKSILKGIKDSKKMIKKLRTK